jgi:hypothetical protein
MQQKTGAVQYRLGTEMREESSIECTENQLLDLSWQKKT